MDNDELSTSVEVTAFQTTFDFAATFGITILTMWTISNGFVRLKYVGSNERYKRNRSESCFS